MTRKIVAGTLSLLALLMGTVLAFTGLPSESNAESGTTITPTAPSTGSVLLPTCTQEDGAGQALCVWDGRVQGNGRGNVVISGDCVLDITGDADTQADCIALHSMNSKVITGEDGETNTVPNGADLVQECNEENAQSELRNCYREW